MIQIIPQYRIKCDSCDKRTGVDTDRARLIRDSLAKKWETKEAEDPVMPECEPSIELFRCPTCVAARRFPRGWNSLD